MHVFDWMFVNTAMKKNVQILHWCILSYKNKHCVYPYVTESATLVNYKT